MSDLTVNSLTQCNKDTCKQVKVDTLNQCRDNGTGKCDSTDDICRISPEKCASSGRTIPYDYESVNVDKSPTFQERLEDAFTKVNTLEHDANTAMEDAVKGKIGIHEAMMQIQEANLSLKLMMQVRSKLMEGFKEIMHMQS